MEERNRLQQSAAGQAERPAGQTGGSGSFLTRCRATVDSVEDRLAVSTLAGKIHLETSCAILKRQHILPHYIVVMLLFDELFSH